MCKSRITDIGNVTSTSKCNISGKVDSVYLDGICFIFLIIQKRIFSSHYFSYLIKEIKAQQVLASRGAELIHEIQSKEVIEQFQAEKEVMEKIRQKMERIRSSQQKGKKRDKKKYHHEAVMSGDYYMFEDPDSEVIDLGEKVPKSLIPDPEGDELNRIAKARGLSSFCLQVMKGDFDFEEKKSIRRYSGDITELGESSKDSAILSVDRDEEERDLDSIKTESTIIPMSSTIKTDTEKEEEVTEKEESIGEETDISINLKDDMEEEPENIITRLESYCRIIFYFFVSCIISITAKLNEVSRDYRYVSRRLRVEKRTLKVLFEMEELDGKQYDSTWKKETLEKISKASVNRTLKSQPSTSSLIKLGRKISKKSTHEQNNGNSDIDHLYLDSNSLVRLSKSILYALLSQSEILCYILIIVNQILNGGLLSLPLPLMVFLWGCLSVPRPSKTFWISLITYTEAIIVTKYIFHFRVWPWFEVDSISPFHPPKIIGVGLNDDGEVNTGSDLALLLMLFFHRFMLKSLGLWDLDSSKEIKKLSMINTSKHDTSQAKNGNRDRDLEKPGTSSHFLQTSEDFEKSLIESKEEQLKFNEKFTCSKEPEFDAVYDLIHAPVGFINTLNQCFTPLGAFFRLILQPTFRIAKDYYALMFFCDFINFFILVFGYSAFGSSYSDASITTYFEENRVPIPFLLMILAQFALIVIDRALYLRKNIYGRLIFHILVVIIIHICLFFVLPAFTGREFTDSDNMPPKFWYIFKCIYFLLSARQIKSGYPTRILGNCFTKKYSILNRFLFKGYILVPFLYDLRLIMDWIWTDTSLDLEEWAIMEDMYKHLFERKCDLIFDEQFPIPKGESARKTGKYLYGGMYLILIIGLIWFPLVLFALGGTVGEANNPVYIEVEVKFQGYESIFKMKATGNEIRKLTKDEYIDLYNTYKSSPKASSFLSPYDNDDTVLAKINTNSTSIWTISPPSLSNLLSQLKSHETLNIELTWYVSRKKLSKNQALDLTIYNSKIKKITQQNETIRNTIIDMLENANSTSRANLPYMFPNYIKVPEKGVPTIIKTLDIFTPPTRNISIKLQSEENSKISWWNVKDVSCKGKSDPYPWFKRKGCDSLIMILFNDKVFPGALQLISGYGILGLYTTFVLLMFRLIRGLFDNISFHTIYTQMPCVDRVLQLCLDIYLVRESREFGLEEDLYAKLMFLYRSPETLIRWTRPLPIHNVQERATDSE